MVGSSQSKKPSRACYLSKLYSCVFSDKANRGRDGNDPPHGASKLQTTSGRKKQSDGLPDCKYLCNAQVISSNVKQKKTFCLD